jgi:hypothetical protein
MHRTRFPDIVLYCLAGFMLAFFLSMRVFNDGVPGWKQIITSDGRGYYAYLPAFILDHDPTFAKVVEREARLLRYQHYKPGYLVKSGDQTLNKYFAGEALLLLPFFLTGTLFSAIAGTEISGYSFFFQVFAGLGTLFYLFMGLIFLQRIMEKMHIRPTVAALTIIAILLGTNLFYYSLWQPTMSHIFSFFAINGFMWYSMRAIQEWRIKSALLMGFFLGMVCLIRPTNILVIMLIPFLSDDKHQLIRFLRAVWRKKSALLVMILVFFIIISLQGLLWYIQTGQIAVWSYHGEGFNFGHPEFLNVLFSFRKGLFTYTPLILISLTGLAPLISSKRYQFFSIIIFLMASTYIVASWWNWYYGDGFGLRAFIDYYGVFAILLALVMNYSRSKAGDILVLFILTPFVVLNMVQTWQYTHLVIQPNSMNAAKYRHIFMRTDSAVINCLGGNEEIASYNINLLHPVRVFANDFEQSAYGWFNNSIVETTRAFSGSHAGYLDSLHQFSPTIAFRAGELCQLPATCYVTGELMVWDSLRGASNGALVVLSMDTIHPGENWWQGFRLNDIPIQTSKTWRKCTFSLMLPEISNPDRVLKIYIWNTGKKPILIDDFTVRFYGSR